MRKATFLGTFEYCSQMITALPKNLFNRIKAGGKGGRPGQWSARKAQMMAKAYKKAGGGYK